MHKPQVVSCGSMSCTLGPAAWMVLLQKCPLSIGICKLVENGIPARMTTTCICNYEAKILFLQKTNLRKWNGFQTLIYLSHNHLASWFIFVHLCIFWDGTVSCLMFTYLNIALDWNFIFCCKSGRLYLCEGCFLLEKYFEQRKTTSEESWVVSSATWVVLSGSVRAALGSVPKSLALESQR